MESILGFSDDELVDAMNLTPIGRVLSDFGNEMQEKLRESIQREGLTDSFELWQNINVTATIFGQKYNFQLKMADYYDYLNKGVRGVGGTRKDGRPYIVKTSNTPYFYKDKKPPINDLRFWAMRKGINPFAAQNSIYHKGIEKTEFYDKVVTQDRLQRLSEDLSKAAKKEVQVFIRATARGITGGTVA